MNFSLRALKTGLLALALVAPTRALAQNPAPTDATKADKAQPAESVGSSEAGTTDEEKPGAKNGPKTLEERIRPVSGTLFVRKGRSELAPNLNISVNDAFFQKYMFGLKYAYHLSDSVAIGLHGAFGISTPSGTVNVCDPSSCSTPNKDQLVHTPGNMTLVAGVDAEWSPLYGKLNILAEKVLHFDTFVLAGVDGIQYANPAEDGASAFTFGGHAGVGQHFVLNEWSAIRVELRDYIYQGNREVNGLAQSHLENQLMLEIGFSFFLPLHASEG